MLSDTGVDAFILLFVVIDPIGVASLFCAITRGYSAKAARKTALRGVGIAFILILAFTLGGGSLLKNLGVTMAAFTVAGGILLFLLAVDMVGVQQSGLRTATESEQREAEHKTDISVFPLAIPMIAGPGTLTTVLLLTGEHENVQMIFEVILAVCIVLLITLAMLLASRWIQALLGETGVNVVVRVFGIILAALAVQYISNGLHQLNLVDVDAMYLTSQLAVDDIISKVSTSLVD